MGAVAGGDVRQACHVFRPLAQAAEGAVVVTGGAETVQAQGKGSVRQRQGIALVQQGRHTGRQGAVPVFPGAQQQTGQPGRQGQFHQLPAQGRGQQFFRAGRDGSQSGQLFPGHGQMGLGGQVQPGQVLGPACAPDGQVQAERRKVRIQDLRSLPGAEAVFLGLLPQAAADAGLQAAGATGPLPGPGQRDAHGLQTGKAAGRIEAALAGKARVHHQADALDGQGGLGDGRGQDDLAFARGRRSDGRILLLRAQHPVEGVKAGIGGQAPFQQFGHAADLARAGQEGQQTAGFLTHEGRDDIGHVRPQGLGAAVGRGGRQRQIALLHGETAALAGDDRRVFQQGGHLVAVQRGGHDQQAQVWPEHGPALQAEGQSHVGLQGALVEFVEDDAAHTGQFGVGQQAAGQHALGDDLQPGPGRDGALLPHAVAHGLAHILAQQAGGVACQGPGSHPARLQQQDLPAFQPGGLQQPQGHAAAFPGAGRGAQDGIALLQGAGKCRTDGIHGSGGKIGTTAGPGCGRGIFHDGRAERDVHPCFFTGN